MLKHNLTLFFRNIRKLQINFLINLVGLSGGLVCTLLIYLWVNDELSVDKFHLNEAQLYQAMVNYTFSDGISTERATPALLSETMANEFPEVQNAVATTFGITMPPFSLFLPDKIIKANGHFVGEEFFNMFSYDLIQGDGNQVLKDKNAIAISEALAINLFGTSDNITGKTVEWELQGDKKQAFISGVFKPVPNNSSDQFDFVLSFEHFKDILGSDLNDWGSISASTYVLLNKEASISDFNEKVAGYIKSKNPYSQMDLFLRPYADKYLYDNYENGVQAGGRIDYVKLFSIIALFILLIACVNFMNLSTAKASHKLKEVGIKKALGADRKSLIFQYMGESVGMVFISLVFSLILLWLLLPQFNVITGKALLFDFGPEVVLTIFMITLLTGIIAGSYPALYLSAFKPVSIIKGKFSRSLGEVWARKGLVVFQFCLSVILIVAVMVVYKQVEFIQSKNLGYSKENVVFIEIEGKVKENLETFISELKNIPGIINASSTSHRLVGHQSKTSDLQWETKNPEDDIAFEIGRVNYDMIETLGIEIADGRAFSRNFSTDSTKIIFNQEAIALMGLDEPIGKTIKLWENEMEIIGVVKDFHFESLHEKVKPIFFIIEPERTENIVAKIQSGREAETVASLQDFYSSFNPGFDFEFRFMDQNFQTQYQAEQRIATLSQYFAGLAILISCLGLFGLAAFTAERRIKEIGIRKVLGSSEFQIVKLLTSDFTSTVLIAIIISLPISYWTVSKWLQNFEYRVDFQWWYFVGAGTLALFVAWITVASQAIKATKANPVKNLKFE